MRHQRQIFDQQIIKKEFNLQSVLNGVDIEVSDVIENSDKFFHSGEMQFDFADLICVIDYDINWDNDGDVYSANVWESYTVDEYGRQKPLADEAKEEIENFIKN